MRVPLLEIGHLTMSVPIVQGGMGVGISLSGLASAVANTGGIGVIAGAEIGFNFPNYLKSKLKTNLEALRYHIRRARELSPLGVLGVNLMVAINNYDDMVRTAVEEKIDIIFSGAGLPLHLPRLTAGSKTLVSPIVSSGRGAEVICKQWDRKYNYLPDAIVVEGPLAGGHLGFNLNQLTGNPPTLESLVLEVRNVIKPFEEKYGRRVPIIAGGGITTGGEAGYLLTHGAEGIQMGTLFALTQECDASPAWKNELLRATKEDVIIIQSPVGMPGRAVRNQFLDEVAKGHRKPIRCGINCLKPCQPKDAPYCIAEALINAQKGNLDAGFAFSGANVYKVNKIRTVQEVVNQLCEEIYEYHPDDISV